MKEAGTGSAYEELLYLPHHVSDVHPRMAMIDRAAQFAPFAALTGYEEAVYKKNGRGSGERIW